VFLVKLFVVTRRHGDYAVFPAPCCTHFPPATASCHFECGIGAFCPTGNSNGCFSSGNLRQVGRSLSGYGNPRSCLPLRGVLSSSRPTLIPKMHFSTNTSYSISCRADFLALGRNSRYLIGGYPSHLAQKIGTAVFVL
jgi:hypothetical protein